MSYNIFYGFRYQLKQSSNHRMGHSIYVMVCNFSKGPIILFSNLNLPYFSPFLLLLQFSFLSCLLSNAQLTVLLAFAQTHFSIVIYTLIFNNSFRYNRIYMKLIILSLLIILGFALRDDPKYWAKFSEDKVSPSLQTPTYGQNQLWFKQIVDHFNYQTSSTWDQRYWVVDNFFNPKVGPVFVFICGQYVCHGVPDSRQWVVTMAQKLQGLILVLEHRYYGQSMPFGKQSLNLDKMVYLNSEQALSDLAYFIQQMRDTHTHKIADNSPFITIGGSYPGALSAWFRYKYPHLTIGAIASSAVVLAIEDYKDFDEQMYMSSVLSGDFCYQAINASSTRVQQILKSAEGAAFKAQFAGGDKLTDDQFLFFWIDSIVGLIQYGQRTTLCNSLKGKNAEQQHQYFIGNAHNNDVYEYGSYYLKNVTFAIENGQGSRSWYYQSCTEYGYWQTFSDRHPLRSFRLNLDFYKKFCNDAFGNNMWPKVERKNIQYGGLDLKAFNLLMSNGVQDPWRWASLQQSKGNIISRVANCTDCAHCVDLYTPRADDAAELKKIRDQQYLTVLGWIQAHWRNQSKIENPHEDHKSHDSHNNFMRVNKLRFNSYSINEE